MIQLDISQVETCIRVDSQVAVDEIDLLQLSFPKFIDLLIDNNLFAQIGQEKPICVVDCESGAAVQADFQSFVGQPTLSMRVVFRVPKIERSISEKSGKDVACKCELTICEATS